jgi:hypothetical protein
MGGIEETDFGHLVGKVEGREGEVRRVAKGDGKAGKEFNEDITPFVDRYGRMFQSDEEVVGKLGAYFHTKNSGSC